MLGALKGYRLACKCWTTGEITETAKSVSLTHVFFNLAMTITDYLSIGRNLFPSAESVMSFIVINFCDNTVKHMGTDIK